MVPRGIPKLVLVPVMGIPDLIMLVMHVESKTRTFQHTAPQRYTTSTKVKLFVEGRYYFAAETF